MAKKTIEDLINGFFQDFDYDQMVEFMKEILPLVDLYNVDEENDWVARAVNEDPQSVQIIRLVKTVYIMSRICDKFSGRFCLLSMKYKELWRKMAIIRDNHQS